jgi:hypothetical protein
MAMALLVSPAFAQSVPFDAVPVPSAIQVASLASNVGINATCAKAFLAAHNNNPPQSLSELNAFIATAPATSLCTQAAMLSLVNHAPPPTDAQISSFAQNVGINVTCAKAFVDVNNALPQSLSELNLFMAFAPASDLCSPIAVATASRAAPPPTDIQTAAFAQTVGINETCARAFVAHNGVLPPSLSDLTQFMQAAPPEDLCWL